MDTAKSQGSRYISTRGNNRTEEEFNKSTLILVNSSEQEYGKVVTTTNRFLKLSSNLSYAWS